MAKTLSGKFLMCIVVSLATIASLPARAVDSVEPFVKNLVAAINSGDAERRKAMLHPKTLVCANTAAELFFDDTLARQARRPIPAGYQWSTTKLPPNQPPMFADQFDYPVRPTHLLQIDFATGPHDSTTLLLQLAHEAGRWYEITACPRPETVDAARAARGERAKFEEKVKKLVASVPADLKATAIKLYRDGRKIDAYKHYQSTTGEDLAVSREVVQRLAGE